jgi:hypothetical protein
MKEEKWKKWKEELACAILPLRLEVARLEGGLTGVSEILRQLQERGLERGLFYRNAIVAWEKAWDELFNHCSVWVRYGTASAKDRELCKKMDRLDPRKKEDLR